MVNFCLLSTFIGIKIWGSIVEKMILLLSNDERVDINSQNSKGMRAISELFKNNEIILSDSHAIT